MEFFTGFNSNWVVTGNVIHDNSGNTNQNAGIYLQSTTATISNNTVYNETGYGIFFSTPTSGTTVAANVVGGNTVFGSRYGIYVDGATVSNNLVHDNTTAGIYADDGSVVTGNTVWRQTTTNAEGIDAVGAPNVVVAGNRVYGNYLGILAQDSITLDDNDVYSNLTYGVELTTFANPATKVFNNVIYANSTGGILVTAISQAVLENNTVYQLNGDAINVTGSSSTITIENNILWVQSGFDLDIASNSQTGFVSNNNILYHIGSGAMVGMWNGAAQGTLAAWQTISSQDSHSSEANPNFVNPTGADAVLGYNPNANNGNGLNGGGDDDFFVAAGSPAINTGNAAFKPSLDLLGYTRTNPDLGAYAYRGGSALPPTVSSASDDNGVSIPGASQITVNFSQPLNDIDATASTLYALIGAGPDGVFGTGDDLTYSLTPGYSPGTQQVLLRISGGVLPTGQYQLTIISNSASSIHNLSGIALDGNNDGTPGGNYVTTFSTTGFPAWLSPTSIATWNPATKALTVTGATTIIADPGSDEPVITASGAAAKISFNPTSVAPTIFHIGGLNLTNGATADAATLGSTNHTSRDVLVFGTVNGATPVFTIDSSCQLNLEDNDMIVNYSGASLAPAIRGLLTSGFNNAGSWDGNGIASLAARNDPTLGSALGYADSTSLGLTSFDGVSITTAVLVKYTKYGDNNLDGTVDIGNDFSLSLDGLAAHGSTWMQGDYTYDGKVDLGNDFNLFLRSFLQQKIGSAAQPAASQAIIAPEASLTPQYSAAPVVVPVDAMSSIVVGGMPDKGLFAADASIDPSLFG